MPANIYLPIPQRYENRLNELLKAKSEIRELETRVQELKAELADYVKSQDSIYLPLGRLKYRENVRSRSLNRVSTLDFIRKHFGGKTAEFIDENCTVDRRSEGIWVFLNKRETVVDDCAKNKSSQEISEVIKSVDFDDGLDELFGIVANG